VGDAEERNVISGKASNGIQIQSAGTDGNVVAGNYIGLNAAGTAKLGNGGNGVQIGANDAQGPGFTRVGTDGDGVADAAERNVISGNS
jgi:titin